MKHREEYNKLLKDIAGWTWQAPHEPPAVRKELAGRIRNACHKVCLILDMEDSERDD